MNSGKKLSDISKAIKKDYDQAFKKLEDSFGAIDIVIFDFVFEINTDNKNYEIFSFSKSHADYYDYNKKLWKDFLRESNNRYTSFKSHAPNGWFHIDGKIKSHHQPSNAKNRRTRSIRFFDIRNKRKGFVEDLWLQFIKRQKDKKYNLVWVTSFIYESANKNLHYKDWWVTCYLLLNIKETSNYKNIIRPVVNLLLCKGSIKIYEILLDENNKTIKQQATKSAISQVMARNMSHNIGSHVLSKFKDENEICNVCISGNSDTQYVANNNINSNLSGNKLIAFFNEYLKNRMDFLADIATTDPVMETSMYLVRDILKGFDKNRILLNRISGVSSKIRFKITVKVETTKNFQSIEHLDNSNDPLLSIPNEILGAQAFYILLENIIRNIYKHSNPTVETIEITIKVKDYSSDRSFFEISIFDNSDKPKEEIEEIVKIRNNSFNESVLNNNALRSNNLGTIEMEVCAAYLRCLSINSIEEKSFDLGVSNETKIPKLIYAYSHEHSNDKFSLGYKICISKPKEILVVANEISEFKIKECNNDELQKRGIKVVEVKELSKPTIYNHQILYSLISEETFAKTFGDNFAKLPKRIVYMQSGIDTDSVENFISSIWGKYACEHFFKSKINESYYFIYKSSSKSVEKSNNSILISSNKNNKSDCIYIDDHNAEWNNYKSWYYYDMACNHSRIDKLKDKIFYDNDIKIIAEYLEVVNTSILLIDERLQQNIVNEKKPYNGPGGVTDFTEYFLKQKIFIPNKKEADLNDVTFGKLNVQNFNNKVSNSISDNICCYIKKHIEDVNFVVVHLGILEKMIESGTNKNLERVDDLINQLFGKHRNKLIVTSGRGKPNNLPIDIAFVQLALIQNAVETLYDKFLLTKILYNSRKSI